jgi:hypothetical protein
MDEQKLSQVVHSLSKEQLVEEIFSLAKEVDRLQGYEQKFKELYNIVEKTPILKAKLREADNLVIEENSGKEVLINSAQALIDLAQVCKGKKIST